MSIAIITKKHLQRRTFLRGMGAALALPMLDSMVPAMSAAPVPPARFVITYIPCGAIMADWTPETTGPDYAFKRILKPLEAFRGDISILTGLGQKKAERNGVDDAGEHGRAGAAYLTGVRCRKTGGADVLVGVSVDQIAARAFESQTRFPSLELGCDDTRITGACDNGLSCSYQNTLCWRTPTSPLAVETSPRLIFERLFGTDNVNLTAAERAQRSAERSSVIDMVRDDTRRLEKDLGPTDRHKIDEYLYGVREVEKRFQSADAHGAEFHPAMAKPTGVPVSFTEYLKLMFDLQVLALQTDQTRVITFMYGREASQRTYEELRISDPHHPLTHHRGHEEWIEKVRQINTWHAKMYAYFLGRMKDTRDGAGSLFDSSFLMYGSGISDGNVHSHLNLPLIVSGGGNGRLRHGQHLKYEGEPLTNMFLALLECMDVRAESIGDSTGLLRPFISS